MRRGRRSIFVALSYANDGEASAISSAPCRYLNRLTGFFGLDCGLPAADIHRIPMRAAMCGESVVQAALSGRTRSAIATIRVFRAMFPSGVRYGASLRNGRERFIPANVKHDYFYLFIPFQFRT
ncbi:hypothetical protein LGN30_29565 [Burkholderia seminalis]|uniref:hypothetical protein n=1 Tax=Burkholderia seminalis TaxID=488731 RepID=UPI001CF53A8E|nr:hypothetical protein [Burkholderia seminalis]MCA8427330.1 hypothetical protein [Burkholderia seminalis]